MRGTKWVFERLKVISAFGDQRMVRPTPGRRAFGVPPGGAFDRESAEIARTLSGGTVIELTLGPMIVEATAPTALAVVGGPDGIFGLQTGERLEIWPEGARAYLAEGPFRPSRRLASPPRLGDHAVRVVAGPQADVLNLDGFLAGRYEVGLASNRVGVRLEGLPVNHALSFPSEPAIPGVIQMPPNGQPIVLGPDGPTIGGYPKIAIVIDADLDRIGRLRPGDVVRFELTTINEAREIGLKTREAREQRLAELRISRS